MLTRLRRYDNTEAGMTIVELVVAMGIFSVVASIMLAVLANLESTARQVESLVTNEQDARFALTEVARDIRAANPSLDAYSATSTDYRTRIEMKLGPQAGPQTRIRWVYDVNPASPNYRTLRREHLNSAGAVTASAIRLRNVRNIDRGVHLFTFYTQNGTDIVADPTLTGNDVAQCARHVEIVLIADPRTGPTPFTVRSDAQIRNQLTGGSGC